MNKEENQSIDIKNLFKGFKNLIFKNKEIEPEAERKLSICFSCPVRTEGKCDKFKSDKAVKDFIYRGENRIKGKVYKGCGCYLELKTRSSSQCPLGKF